MSNDHPVIGGWQLRRRVGSGGTATVWRAVGTGGSDACIKRLHAPLIDAPARRRFARERDVLERLGPHPHITRLLASGITDDHVGWFAFDAYQRTLADRLATDEAIDPADVRRTAIALTRALDHAHRRGIAHGDVKPANVLLDATGRIALSDFGAAAADDTPHTRVQSLSPDWAAPERLAGASPDAASDLYSLGRTLRALLAAGPAARPNEPARDGTDALDTLVCELCRTPTSARPRSAAAVLQRLGDVDANAPDASAAPTVPCVTTVPTAGAAVPLALPDAPRRPTSSRRLPVSLAALVTLAVPAGLIAMQQRDAAPTIDDACPIGAYLCDRFDSNAANWTREESAATARFTFDDDGLVRTPGDATGDAAPSQLWQGIAAPPGDDPLRLRTRLRFDVGALADSHAGTRLVSIENARGQLWSANLSVQANGANGPALQFDAYYHAAGQHDDRQLLTGAGVDGALPVCLEAILTRPVDADWRYALYLDGRFAGAFEHPAPAPADDGAAHWFVALGGGADSPASIPPMVYESLVVDSGSTPTCERV